MAKKKKTSKKSSASRKKAGGGTGGSGGAGGTGGTGSLKGLSISELNAEIRRRERGVSRLMSKREKLATQLAALDAEIASLGGEISGMNGGVRRRPRNKQNLSEALVALLKGRSMSVTEAAEEVQKAGYQTSSANFRVIVNQTLLRDPRIKKVARGQYTAK